MIALRLLPMPLALLALAACHQPTGRVSEGGGTFLPPHRLDYAPKSQGSE